MTSPEVISGNNFSREEMEMTVPVNQRNPDKGGKEMEMTVPVVQNAKLKTADGKMLDANNIIASFNPENNSRISAVVLK